MADQNLTSACCTIPPIVATDYQPKGSFTTIDNRKTYTCGPKHAKAGIVIIYDIFGYKMQTQQGADILALSADKDVSRSSSRSSSSSDEDDDKKGHRGYQIFMPDFLDGQEADPSLFPPTDDDKKQRLTAFLQGPAEPGRTLEKIAPYMDALQKEYPRIERWGVVGYCWGGKIVSKLAAGPDTRFKVAAECHPAMMAPEDAKDISIPIVILASRDEDKEAVRGFRENLKGESLVETFEEMSHGWMAARADLNDEKQRAEYERGYRMLLDFFYKHL